MATQFKKSGHRPDYFLLALTFILIAFGLAILSSASSDLGKIKWNDSYYYLKHQVFYGLLPGLAGFFLAYKINYQRYRKFSFALLLVNLGLLVLVFTRFGIVAGGASRWIKFGPLMFQPAEFLKITFILYLAAWLANAKLNRAKDLIHGIIPFLVVLGFVAGLLLFQPATSTVVILVGAGLIILFLSGAPLKHIFLITGAGALCLVLVILITPYRYARIKSFLNPRSDIEGSGYQVDRALTSIGSGGAWGVGYGQSTSKVNSLPAPLGDSIFAVAAQELGFVGAGSLVVLFGTLVFRIIWIAKQMRDRFGQLTLIGFASVIALQSFVNMAAISGLIPLTGVPLPFVSYGGTALAVFIIMMGISVNISKYLT